MPHQSIVPYQHDKRNNNVVKNNSAIQQYYVVDNQIGTKCIANVQQLTDDVQMLKQQIKEQNFIINTIQNIIKYIIKLFKMESIKQRFKIGQKQQLMITA